MEQEALDTKFMCHDLGEEIAVRDYLKRLLHTLFEQGEGFSGKRPFGNSGWENDLAVPMIVGGFIAGEIDDGYGELADQDAFDALIHKLIDAL